MSTKLKVDASSLTVVKLVKKDVDVTTLKFVNFKLGIPAHLYDSVCKNDFWPNSVKVNRFIHRERAIVVGDGILSNLPELGQNSTPSHPSKNPKCLTPLALILLRDIFFMPLSESLSQQDRQLLAFSLHPYHLQSLS